MVPIPKYLFVDTALWLEGTSPARPWRALRFLQLNMGVTAISKIHSKTLNVK